MIKKFKRKTTLLKLLASFKKDEQGVTAVEFALLAVPFFSLVAIILQTAVIFIAGMVLDNAVNDSIRLIRTGQAEEQSFNITNFRVALCDGTVGLFGKDCPNIKIRVKVLPTFASSNISQPIIDPDDGEWEVVEAYDGGDGNSIIIAEAYYKWKPVIDFKWLNIGASADGTILLGSVRVWRNEPFPSNN